MGIAFDPNVYRMQVELNRHGFNLDPDGKLGPLTQRAIDAYEKRNKSTDETAAFVALKTPMPRPPTLPKKGYTSVGDSIVVGIDAQYRARSAFKRLDYHYRKNGVNPEMVGKTTSYIHDRLVREVIPAAKRAGIETVVMDGGANDILRPMKTDEEAEAVYQRVTAAIRENIAVARRAGLRVIALTLPPEARFIDRTFPEATRARGHALCARIDAFMSSLAGTPEGPTALINVGNLIGEKVDGKNRFRDEYASKVDLLHPLPNGSAVVARAVEAKLVELER